MFKVGILDVNGKKVSLRFGKEYFVGRKSDEFSHDIEIDDPSADIKHSIIDLTQTSSPQLFDVCSKHGTFVNGLKILRFKSTLLSKTSKIRFGNVETSLQLLNESDSGFLEERLSSPTKDTSDFICNSPEQIVSSGSRLKNSLKNSLTSTPNVSTAASTPSASKSIDNFLIPSCLPRTSIGSNTSARSVDSFYIPETQHVPEAINSRSNNSTNISIHSNRSTKNNSTAGDDDFFIPETQEVINLAIPLCNRARVAFSNNDINETLSQEDRIPSSQFRICTQDFNGSEEDLSNHSGDILANVPLSMIIPPIQYEPVQVDDFVKDEEDEMDKEMSALQWSKRTLEDDANGSVTPDGLFDVVGSVTADLIQVKIAEKAPSQCSTPDIFANPEEPEIVANNSNTIEKLEGVEKEEVLECGNITDIVESLKESENFATKVNTGELNEKGENATKEVSPENINNPPTEIELPPTQVFFKPILMNKSITSPFLPPAPPAKENNGIEDDDDFFLPETQVFTSPTIKPKPKPNALAKPQSSPAQNANKTNISTAFPDLEKKHGFALPLASPKLRASPKTQTSSKPQVSPKPQEPQKSSASAVPTYDDDLPPTQVFVKEDHVPVFITNVCFSSTLVDCEMQLSENSFKAKFNKLLDSDDDEMDEVVAPELVKKMRQSLENPIQPVSSIEIPLSPETNSEVPSKESENNLPDEGSPTPTTTPDNNNFRIPVKASGTKSKAPAVSIDHFLLTPDFLGKEFSKNSQVQREADLNWRNLVLEKRTKGLFGDEKDSNSENIDLDESQDSFIDLLPNRREIRAKSVNNSSNEKVIEPKVMEPEVVCGRITRRKSVLLTESKQGSRNTNAITKEEDNTKEPRKRGRKKIETQTSVTKDQKADTNKDSKELKIAMNEKVSEKVSKSDKELKGEEEKKVKNSSKTEETSAKLKDVKIVENSSFSKNSSSSLVKDPSIAKSDFGKKDKILDKPSLKKESSSIKISTAIKDPIKVKVPDVSKESSLTRSISSTSVNTSKEPKQKIESSKNSVNERPTRTRRKVEEPPPKVEEKSSRSKAVKRNAEVSKSSSKSSKINKLDEIEVFSKQAADKPVPRRTRLRTNSELKVEDKKVTLNNNREKKETVTKYGVKKDAVKKEELTKKESTSNNNGTAEELIDLTHSDVEDKNNDKKSSRKRKSQDEYIPQGRKSTISASQSSADSADSDRTLRRKKKIKIAMSCCSPSTKESLVRFSGRVWDYTEDPKECEVLIVETGQRTYKILVAIARGVPVVKVDWLNEVISMRSTNVSFDKHIFDEKKFQERHKFVMRDVLQLARNISLFKNMNFMMTPNINPKPDEMKDIIVSAGGTVLTNIPTSKNDQPFYLVSIKTDSQLWYRYRRASPNVKVVTAISLMDSVMQQSLDPLSKTIN